MGSFIGRFKDQHIESSDDEFDNLEKGKAALVAEKQKKVKWWHIRSRLRGGAKKKKPAKGSGGAYLFLQYLNSVPVHLHGPDGPAKDMLVLQIKGGKNPGNLDSIGKEGLESMYMVDMQKIGLETIPKGIDGANQLRVAQFSWNYIKHVDVLIAKIDTLTNLVLDHNKIQKISPLIFDGKKFVSLRVMNLSYNELDILPLNFGIGLESLEYLDLSHNVLTELPDNLTQCKQLKSLFCTHNSLLSLPSKMGDLVALERVFVSFNKLTYMPSSLANCYNIERIRVIGNQLRELPVAWISLLHEEKWKDAFSGEEPPRRTERQVGKLVELLVERNPLVRPPITAFDEVVGGLGNAFRLFYEDTLYEGASKVSGDDAPLEETAHRDSHVEKVDSKTLQLEDAKDGAGNVGEARMSMDNTNAPDATQNNADRERLAYETYYMSRYAMNEYTGEKIRDDDGNDVIEPLPEGEKALIRSIQSTMLFRKRTQTIDELLASGIKETNDNSPILASDFDMQFCLFVCATKEQFKTAATLFDKIESQGNELDGKPYVTPTEWHHYCARAPLRLEHDVQTRMWDLMAVNNGQHLDRVFVHDFIAAWMIHDLEYKDLWIDRITKVLRMGYYQLTIEDMTSKVYAKLRSSADHAERYNAPPILEGERIVRQNDPPPKQARGDEAELSGAAPKAHVFVSADDKTGAIDEDAIVSDLEVDSSDLSDSEDTKGSDEELKAQEWAQEKQQELGSEAEELDLNAGPATQHERIDITTISGFNQLMSKPVSFFRQLGKETDHHGDSTHAPLAKAVTQKKKKKQAAKDPRFSTDMLEVRIQIRNAFRAMSPQTFTLLINWLVRVMRNMQSAARPQQTYLHVDDPVYSMLVQRKEVESLLETLGFVQMERWWVWPRLHLPYACPPIDRDARGASWGLANVHTGCQGTHKDRLEDCVVLLRACQQEIQTRKSKGDFHGTFK
jgi:Leucine-rich repeat (LRR) protein